MNFHYLVGTFAILASPLRGAIDVAQFSMGRPPAAIDSVPAPVAARLDSAVRLVLTKHQVPGASVLIVRNNAVEWERGYGFADLEDRTVASSSTLFRLASASKAITSVAVMQLIEEGRLRLDDSIQAYVPEFPVKRYPVTLRALLAATSGIRGYQGTEYLSAKPYPSLAASLPIFAADSLLYEPGTAYTETPYGFTLLGLAIERVSGLSFAEFLRRRVFVPAGIHTAQPDVPAAIIKGRSRFYSRDSAGSIHNAPIIDASYKLPAGGLIASTRDLAAFGTSLISGRLISPLSFRLMSTPIRLRNGQVIPLGWGLAIGDVGQRYRVRKEAVWTAGLQQGATTVLYLLPQRHLVIAIATNLDNGSSLLTDLVNLSESLATTILDAKSPK